MFKVILQEKSYCLPGVTTVADNFIKIEQIHILKDHVFENV